MNPVWRNKRELLTILARYREWYAKGFTDTQVSAAMRQVDLHNGRAP